MVQCGMTETVTNELILEHLKAIQGRLTNIEDETRIMRTEITGMSQTIAAHSLRLDRMERRLDRIERRLDLAESTSG